MDTPKHILTPAPAATGGQHTVTVIVTDSTPTAWSVTATVGEDWTVAGQYLPLKDAEGGLHPALRAYIYSDCVDVGAVPGSSTTDYSGTLKVSYDGATVFGPTAVEFKRGCLNQTLRYGIQAPWKPVDLSLFPNWATPTAPLPLIDLAKYDLSYNGMGVATYKEMGTTGARADICYVPQWDVPFCLQPSDASYAVVRAAADHSGVWPIYFVDNNGSPFDITLYPNTTFLPYGQDVFKGNPIAAYAPNHNRISGSPFAWDEAHETGYNFVAAAATGTARDRFHASVWANAMLTALNPQYRQANGVWQHYQERGSAWAIRSLFLAAYVSDMTVYFSERLNDQLNFANNIPQNSFGLLATYLGETPAPNGPGTALALWEENYLRGVLDVVQNKIPGWRPFAAYLGSLIPQVLAGNTYPLSTVYSWTCKDKDKNWLPTIRAMMAVSLTGSGWSEADAAAATADGVTLEQVYALQVKYGFKGKLGDLAQYDGAPDAYPALMRLAVVAAVNAGVLGSQACWTLMQSLPTQPDFSREWGNNVLPRT